MCVYTASQLTAKRSSIASILLILSRLSDILAFMGYLLGAITTNKPDADEKQRYQLRMHVTGPETIDEYALPVVGVVQV